MRRNQREISDTTSVVQHHGQLCKQEIDQVYDLFKCMKNSTSLSQTGYFSRSYEIHCSIEELVRYSSDLRRHTMNKDDEDWFTEQRQFKVRQQVRVNLYIQLNVQNYSCYSLFYLFICKSSFSDVKSP